MSTPLIICIVIFILTLVSFTLNKIPMWVTAMSSMILLILTGCLKPATALSGFSNTNTILMSGMFIVAAGLRRTSFVHNLCGGVMSITKGSFQKAFFGYIVITAVLTNFISSPMVVFSIVAPLVATLCEESNVSPSKVMFPIAVVSIGCCQILPTDAAITQASQNNAFLQTFKVTAYSMNATDFFIGKWPLLIILPLWALLAPKFMPEKPIIPISGSFGSIKNEKPLSKFSDTAGMIIFFITLICLIFSTKIHVDTWIIAAIGSVLMVICGVLNTKEAMSGLPIDMILLFVGSLGLGGALSETGAGDVIGKALSAMVGGTRNGYIIGALFFLIPFILSQFMLHRAVMQIFTPVCILTCKALGADPIGPMLLVCAGCTSAFMTPMSTPAVPMSMAAGGYDMKALLKGGWLISIILMIFYSIYVITVFPVFH